MPELNLQKLASQPIVPFRPGELPEGIEGDINPEDRNIQRLKQIQNVGDASQAWPQNRGDFLVNNTLCPKPIEISIFGASGYYIQNLIFGSEERPARYKTAQDVIAAGGNLKQYVKAGQDDLNFVPASDLYAVLSYPNVQAEPIVPSVASVNGKPKAKAPAKAKKAPATNGKAWFSEVENVLVLDEKTVLIPAMWTARGTSYRLLLPRLRAVEASMKRANQPLIAARFKLEGTSQKIGVNNIWVPVLTLLPELNSSDFTSFVRKSFKGE